MLICFLLLLPGSEARLSCAGYAVTFQMLMYARFAMTNNGIARWFVVVENVKDVLSIENTGQYHGVYHVLGGIISPMEGIGPADLRIEQLEQRVAEGIIKEIIFAFSATAEGDTTSFYLYRRLSRFDVQISSIAPWCCHRR